MKPIGGIFSVGVEEPYRWKGSVQDPLEIQLWAIDGIANGLRPWFAKFNGKPFDRRWFQPVEDLYRWHFDNEKYLRNTENLARVALVFSQQTARFYGGEQAGAKVENPINGMYQALIEARVPFEMMHDRKLDEAGRFDLVILPNIAALSNAQCAQIRQYVERGGSLLATHETSLYDEWGVRRGDFGLADVFGAKFEGKVDGRMQNSYLNVHMPHPLVKGFELAPRIINGTARVHTKALRGEAPLTLVPSYPDLPMEDVYPRVARTNIPGVHVSEFGRGRVIYFPWDIDRTFWEVLSKDHLKLIRNAVEWGTRGRSPVVVTGQGVFDVTFWKQRGSLAVHIVNLTNPMMMKGPIREVFAVGPVTARIEVPEGLRAGAIRLRVGDREPVHRREGQVITVDIPRIEMHELISIDL
jgi:hypothetical protein